MWWGFTVGRSWCSVGTVATLSSSVLIQFVVWIFFFLIISYCHQTILAQCRSSFRCIFSTFIFLTQFFCIFYSEYPYQCPRIQNNLNMFTFSKKYEELRSNRINDAKNIIWPVVKSKIPPPPQIPENLGCLEFSSLRTSDWKLFCLTGSRLMLIGAFRELWKMSLGSY